MRIFFKALGPLSRCKYALYHANDLCYQYPVQQTAARLGLRTILFFLKSLCLIQPACVATIAVADDIQISKNAGVFVVFNSADGVSEERDDTLVFLLASNGQVIQREKNSDGEHMYFTRRISTREAVDKLEKIHGMLREFKDLALNSLVVLHGSKTTLLIELDGSEISIESSHDVYEENPNLVCTVRGVERLNGLKKLDILARQPNSYLLFRSAWSELRRTAESVQSKESSLTSGRLTRIDTKLWWKEN